MSIVTHEPMNEDYEPTGNEDDVVEVLTEGRATPKYLKDLTDLNDQQINYALNQLIAAGWVNKVTTGLYELVGDPREGGADETIGVDAALVEQLVEAQERGDPDAIRDAVEALCEDYGDPDE